MTRGSRSSKASAKSTKTAARAKSPAKTRAPERSVRKRSAKAKSDGGLEVYRAKRDFSKTAEPSGAREVAKAEQLRFVVQKHAATRLHYDLRLELDGVFKSWAVTKGPSLDPGDKRLAVEVEDHPLDYGDFEGVIPKGEYGGGTVLLWDRGFWAPEPGQDPEKALRAGELKFVLAGERLKGSWVLVRMKPRPGERRKNWLLIKHQDEHAHAGGADVLDESDSVASGRGMEEIAAGRGRKPKPFMLRVETAADAVWRSKPKTAAGARKTPAPTRPARSAGSMPSFVPPQLCTLATTAPSGSDWAHEVKFDGYRIQVRVQAGRATLRTRHGLDWTERFGAVARAARVLPDCLIDGELVATDARGEPSFAALQAAIAEEKTDALIYYAFDLLFADDEDLRGLPLVARKARLEAVLDDVGDPIRYTPHLTAPGRELVEAACAMKLEGVVSKRLDAPYRSGRTASWIKVKCRRGESVVIGGWTEDNGRFRSLLAGVPDGGKLRYVGRIGTGYGRDVVERLTPRLLAAEAQASPFADAPSLRGARWTRPELVAEVGFAGWTGEGYLRQASFQGLREDLETREVRISEPEPPPEPASKPSSGRSASSGRGRSSPFKVRGQTISSPDKALWPAEGLTKADLAAYLDAVGDWILPHVKGRPCSLVRAPDGVDAESFFQRHAGQHAPDSFTLAKVRGDKQPYVQLDSVEALVAAAQLAALELHPWNCRPGAPEVPGRLVFDLDPAPDVGFDAVVDAAKELRDRLSALGLESFCKTTGGKGLHVVAPLAHVARKPLAWPEAKTFAHDVCKAMAADAPDRFLTVMTKSKRTGRIFLDYLRNDRTATAVAPLSPRARPGATVSMPLNWPQVRKGLDPTRFTISSAPDALAKTKPWRGYEAAEGSLRDAAERLG